MKVDFQVYKNKYIPTGMIVLKRNGKIVWCGPISAPWEDVECDSAEVSLEDFDRWMKRLLRGGQGLRP